MFVRFCTDTPTTEQETTEQETAESGPWTHVHIPVIEPIGWAQSEVNAGLRSLDRLRAELDIATALLVSSRPEDRDATASLSRLCKISNREARFRRAVAAVITALPQARILLQSGAISAEHVAALRAVIDKPGVESLLASGVGMSPEDFARKVQQFGLSAEHGEDVAARQHAARSLRFTAGPDGMVRLIGLLPSIQGATLETLLGAISEANYQRNHPERARVLGGHNTDTRDQRLADALLELAGIVPSTAAGTSRSTTAGESKRCEAGRATVDAEDVDKVDGTDNRDGTYQSDGSTSGDPTGEASPLNVRVDRPPIRVTTSKPATVIVFNVERFQAEMLNHGPVPVTSSLFDDIARDLYFCFENDAGEVLKYVRGRRQPSLLQKIAVWVRDLRCQYPGCDSAATQSHIHHVNEWLADQGFTDIEVLILLCHAHHQHLHVNQLIANREADGSVSIRLRGTAELIAMARPRRIAA